MNKSFPRILSAAAALLAATVPGRAQWMTQTFDLKAGWNAVFLHVDPSHASIAQHVAPDPNTTIEEIWMWQSPGALGQFVQSPQTPVVGGSQWMHWKRLDVLNSTLQTLVPNNAYLVKIRSDVPTYAWALKGKAVVPRYQWTSSGLNFVGFPTVKPGPPNFEDFLAQSPPDFQQTAEIYRYPGGNLGPGNPLRVFALRTTLVNRGEAYWVRAGEVYNRYYGPFEVVLGGGGLVDFGDSTGLKSFRLRNLTPGELTISLNLGASETPPAGQPAIEGLPPLLVRGERSPVDLTYGYQTLPEGTARSWTLAPFGQPGSEVEVVLGLDRSVLAGDVGDLFGGVLAFTDSLGQSRVDVGVTASIGSRAGLWVGNAAVTQVGQYLKVYEKGGDNRPVIGPDGNYLLQSVNTGMGGVPASYPLRLIVHNPATGPARLFQKLFYGMNAATNPIVASAEVALAPNLLSQARRLSVTHLPWSPGNEGWSFSGPLALGSTITAEVTNRFDNQSSNPFLHTYHPDHDNLNPRALAEVPQGSESYTLVRSITLNVTPPTDDFLSRTMSGQSVSGTYLESVQLRGLARPGNTFDTRTFEVRGLFSLNRISDIPVVTRP